MKLSFDTCKQHQKQRNEASTVTLKCRDKNAVATSWMMEQARGDRDVPSEPLGNFYWSMRQVTNACNFARGVLENPRRIGRAVLLGRVWGEAPRL